MEVRDLRSEALAGDLEGEERAGAVLEEGVDLGKAGQPVVLLADAAIERDPLLGFVEDLDDLPGRKAFDAEQMAGKGHRVRLAMPPAADKAER
jgi:hypothetical protein